jgi:15-cis-phytoene desaturase
VFLTELITPLGIANDEVAFFVTRLLILATSCPERRVGEYENVRWWDFIAAQRMSATYQTYLGQGLTRSLVAMRPEESSTRTVGYILLQLFYGLALPDRVFDRLLMGPTDDVWINPWVDYLGRCNVRFHQNVRVTAFDLTGKTIRSVGGDQGGQAIEIAADYYIAALPVEVMASLMTDEVRDAAPSLANLDKLQVRWMNGIQFYLRDDEPIADGHAIYLDSPWALTSISQHQFWKNVDLSTYGDGNVRGILSVDVSDWETPGVLFGKPAMVCTPQEIEQEVWAQLQQHLNQGKNVRLDDANLIRWFLDPDIEFPNPTQAANLEPLLINTAGSLQYRPEAQIELANLFLASDYVRTYTDLATMEGANEAARRAVNALLLTSGSKAPPAALWPFEEPAFLKPFQEMDRIRYGLGLAHHLTGPSGAS